MHQIHKDRPIQAKLYSAISVYLLQWLKGFMELQVVVYLGRQRKELHLE